MVVESVWTDSGSETVRPHSSEWLGPGDRVAGDLNDRVFTKTVGGQVAASYSARRVLQYTVDKVGAKL